MKQKAERNIKNFLKDLNIECDIKLLTIAFTHSSFCNENHLPYELCNERLEFLGDAVLKSEISSYLYDLFPKYKEGELSHIRSLVVSDEMLEKIARKIQLQNYIILGQGEEKTNGRNRSSIIACAFEAFLGALFLDNRQESIKLLINSLFADEINCIDEQGLQANPKALLQEYFQAKSTNIPEYVLIKQEGPPHDRIFFVEVHFENTFLASGIGNSKKNAQKDAAYNACVKLKLIQPKGEVNV